MDLFDSLRIEHNRLLEEQQESLPAEEFLPGVKNYVNKVRKSGSKIQSSSQREQLRAILRYWGNYVYENEPEKNKTYPVIDLYPFSGEPGKVNRNVWIMIGVLGGLVVIIFVASFILQLLLNNPNQTETTTPDTSSIQLATLKAAATETFQVELQHTRQYTPTRTRAISPTKATPTPTQTISSEITKIIETPKPTETEETVSSPENANSSLFTISYPQNGQEVFPEFDFSGNYANLRQGWSLYILLQPLSGVGRYYPLESYYTIPENMGEGKWKIHAVLKEQFDIEKEDTYIAVLIVVTTDDLREQLSKSITTGLEQIPPEALYVENSVITFQRPAYRWVKETRIIYASNIEEERNYDLFTILPDGSDLQRITYTQDISEVYPNLSPDGKQIVFIGLESVEDQTVSSIWIMDSSGDNRKKILSEPGITYEKPVWSPDGRFIAFSYRNNVSEKFQGWRKSLLEVNSVYSLVESQDMSQIQTGDLEVFAERYPFWLDSTTILYNLITPENAEIYAWNIKTLEIQKYFSYKPITLQPSTSPDGKYLAFVYYTQEDANRDIYTADLSTGEVTRLTTTPELDTSPQWLPDNITIIYESWSTEKPTIWAVDITGENLKQITFAPLGNDVNPSVGLFDAYFPVASER